MTFFTIKNIGLLLLLVGVLVFPVGINQSHAQDNTASITNLPPTTPPIVVSAIQGATGEISFSGIMDDHDDFGAFTSVILDLTPASGVTNPAPNLSDQVVFNTGDSTLTDTSSKLLLVNEMVMFTVNDEAIVGEYNLEYTVTDSESGATTGNVMFTIVENPNTAPTAPDFGVDLITRGDASIIPFGDNIMDTETNFGDLIITFNSSSSSLVLFEFPSGTTSVEDADGVEIFTVTNGNVGIDSLAGQRQADSLVGRTIPLTYTVSDGALESTGTVTITFIAIPLAINGSLDDLTINVPQSSLPTHTKVFDFTAYSNLINFDTTFGLTVPGIYDIDIDITSPGSAQGTATFIFDEGTTTLIPDDDIAPSATLTYTPAPNFVGSETFTYSGTTVRGTATGVITFIVAPVEICTTSLSGGVVFGELGVGVTSATSPPLILSNTGNVPAQSLIAGADWISVDNTDVVTMNVGQTRYSLTQTDAYDVREPLSETAANVGGALAESGSLNIYLQLFVDLMDGTFRGATTQIMTVTSTCS